MPRAVAGAVVGVALMALSRAGRQTAVPFGPFLALGTVVALFLGAATGDGTNATMLDVYGELGVDGASTEANPLEGDHRGDADALP